jgi:hypothetical protein
MLQAILISVTLGATLPPGDTIVELRRGDRVVVDNLTGDISVQGWDRDVMEVHGEDRADVLAVRRSGREVRIVRGDVRGRRRSVDAVIRVPSWVDLRIGGLSLDVSVRGVDGAVEIGNVSGEIRIVDSDGPVDARSIDGEILVEDVRAGVSASAQSDDVTLRRVRGAVDVHSGSGDILLLDIESESVRAETQDGDIEFRGDIADGGMYGFYVHDGDAVIAVPSSMNARVSVSTFDGEFESEFPVRVERFTSGREFEFVLGDGSARLQIDVFDGEIRLVRIR